MKKILYIVLVLLPFIAKAQNKIYSNHAGFDINGSANVFRIWNGADSVMSFFPNFIRSNKPIFVPTYLYASRPSATFFGGCWVYTSDSAKMYYSNGTAWIDPTAGSGGGGGSTLPFSDNVALIKNSSDATKQLTLSAVNISTGTNRTWTFPDVNGTVARSDGAQTFSGVQTFGAKTVFFTPTTSSASVNFPAGTAPTSPNQGDLSAVSGHLYYHDGSTNYDLLATANAFTQGGNAFGTTATFGTTDNNFLKFIANSVVVFSVFPSGHIAFGASATDPTQFVYFPGTSRWDGTMTIGANGGISVGTGFNFSSFASNTASNSIGFNWGMNNPYTTGVKSANRFAGDMSLSSGTDTITDIDAIPTINNTGSGTYTAIGFRWRPIKTSLTNTKTFAWFNDGGGLIYNVGIPSGTGTENIIVRGADSLDRQITQTQLATSLGLTSFYQQIQSNGSSSGLTQRAKLNFLPPLTATDNSGNTSTDIGIAVTTASGTGDSIATVNPANGQLRRTNLYGIVRNNPLGSTFHGSATAVANCSAASTSSAQHSMFAGGTSMDWGYVTLTVTAANTLTQVAVQCASATTTFTHLYDAYGTCTGTNTTQAGTVPGWATAETGFGYATLNFYPTATGTYTIYYQISYITP